jgi:hypothetical protein
MYAKNNFLTKVELNRFKVFVIKDMPKTPEEQERSSAFCALDRG